MTKILLVRHGHVEGIHPERFRGRVELPLTELGRQQAQLTADKVARLWQPTAIYTSPLQRCIDTGAAIGQRTSAPCSVLAGLHDLDYGQWQWKTFDEARGLDAHLFRLWFEAPHLVRFPGGDALQDLVARTADALRMALAQHTGQTVVFVGHDSVNRAMLLQALDQPFSAYWRVAQSPCAINEFDVDGDGRITVKRLNDTGHLDAKLSP